MKMRLLSNLSVVLLFTCGAFADKLRRELAPTEVSTSDCNHPSAFLILPEVYGICDFPFIITGFGVDGLPPPAAAAHLKQNLRNGLSPDLGVFRVSEDDMTCNSIVKSYISKGKGGRIVVTKSGETWNGNLLIFRPANQTSYVDAFPDQVGGLWEISGRIVFEGNDFTIRSYSGKKPIDICALLE
jgi:hypothetical protein